MSIDVDFFNCILFYFHISGYLSVILWSVYNVFKETTDVQDLYIVNILEGILNRDFSVKYYLLESKQFKKQTMKW